VFNHQYFSAQYFPPVWFAPGDDSHLLEEERQHGGVGHGSKGGKKKRWIERDGKILIFDTPDDVESFIQSEVIEDKPKQQESKRSKAKPNNPVDIIDKQEIERLSVVYEYRRQLYHADQIGDISRIIAIYKELQQREEDDIELLLMVH